MNTYLKKKHWLVLILVGVMVLAACGQPQAPAPDTPPAEENGETPTEAPGADSISVAARAGAMADALKVVAAQYSQETGIDVQVNDMPYDSLKETIVLDVRNNSGAYDLVMMDDPWMPEFGQANILANLDEYFTEGIDEDFVPTTIDLSREPHGTGSLFALPLIGNVQMFFYREDLIEKYDLSPPENWDDVVAIAEVITNEEPDTFGYALRGQRGNPIVSNYLPLFWAYGGQVLDENGAPQVNSEAGVQAMETYIRLKDLGPVGVEAFDSDQIATALTQGQAAMLVAWPSWVAMVDNEESSLVAGNVAFAAVPGQVNESAAMIGNWLLGVPRTSTKVDEAVDFLKWVTSAEVQKEMAMIGGGVPTRRSVYEDPELIEMYRHYPAQLEALERSVARPRTPYWSQIEDSWGMYLSQILAGQVGIQEGLDRANEELTNLLP